MTREFRRVVTRLDENGRSVLAENTVLRPVTSVALPGVEFYKVWGSDQEPSAPVRTPNPIHDPFFPPRHGNRLLFSVFPPDSAAKAPELSPKELEAASEQSFPGLLPVFEPENPGFHTTVTVDYDFVLDGELWIELDGGKEVHLPTGTMVIMNGVRHAWRNKSDRPATLISILIGAQEAGL
jgi:hypothetical protein